MADDSSTEKLRLFVAIPMPETVRNEITGIQQELQRLVSRDAVRWTKPEQFHLTLRFLGDVPVERVTGVAGSHRAVCSRQSGALLCAHEASAFFPMPGHRASFGPGSTTAKGVWWICKRRLRRGPAVHAGAGDGTVCRPCDDRAGQASEPA